MDAIWVHGVEQIGFIRMHGWMVRVVDDGSLSERLLKMPGRPFRCR